MKPSEIFEYLRKRRGGKRVKSGVLLGRKMKGGKVLVSWSKCKLTGDNADTFDPIRGMEIAEGRIASFVKEKRGNHDLPPSIEDSVKAFVNRCKKYFKTKKVKVV